MLKTIAAVSLELTQFVQALNLPLNTAQQPQYYSLTFRTHRDLEGFSSSSELYLRKHNFVQQWAEFIPDCVTHVTQIADGLVTTQGSKTLSALYRHIVGDPCAKSAADTFREALRLVEGKQPTSAYLSQLFLATFHKTGNRQFCG